MTDTRKPKRFEYFWVREWWAPETVQLIQSWGDTLAALADEVVLRRRLRLRLIRQHVTALEELKRSTTPERIVASGEATTLTEDERWWHFNHAVQSCGALRASFFEDVALLLVGQDQVELALKLIAIEEFFEPDDKGIARLHIEALTGGRKKAIRALACVVWDPDRKWGARIRALACLGEVDQEGFDEESRWLLTAASDDGDSLAAHEIQSLIDRYGSAGARVAS